MKSKLIKTIGLTSLTAIMGTLAAPIFAATHSSTVAFLMPDQASTRYELHDYPGFKKAMNKRCPQCKIIYQNANADVALQQQQFNAAITQGAKVIVLDPVDSSAAASLVNMAQSEGIKVIAYDRPIPAKAANYYISFDNKGIGRSIAQSLVKDLERTGVPKDKGGIIEINGSPTDGAARLVRAGVHEGLKNSGYTTLAEYDTPNWVPAKAQSWTSGQIARFGSNIHGVVAANDGTGGAAVAAFKAAGVTPIPPVTGDDATIAGLQLIIAGDQYNTISKPSEIVARAAAKVAVEMLHGKTPKAQSVVYNTPSELFVPKVITQHNIKKLMFDTGIASAKQVCIGRYLADCKKLGITR
ncbi:substrate-binding domain-containing protein [Marinomonas flavescens]|uniref:substrate-binding domain-containing protein n=1 Tax=Marinomonas flavescens TaxID=2529379 RepID=UPI001056345C|nr:substrate-binding domain-containing protein [Marinomonas flavescens]